MDTPHRHSTLDRTGPVDHHDTGHLVDTGDPAANRADHDLIDDLDLDDHDRADDDHDGAGAPRAL